MINNFHAFLSRFLRLDNYDFVENSVKRDIPPSIQSPLSTRHLLQNPSFLSSLLLFLLTSLGHRVTFRFALTFISLAVSFARIAVAVTARKKKRRKKHRAFLPDSLSTYLASNVRVQLLPPPLFSFLSFLSSPERWRRKRRNRVVNGSRPDWKLCSKANGLVTGMLGKIKGGRVLLAEQRCLISVSFFPSLSLPLFLLFLLLVYLIPVFDVQKKRISQPRGGMRILKNLSGTRKR